MKQDNGSNTTFLILAIIILLGMAFYALYTKADTEHKIFAQESLYVGDRGTVEYAEDAYRNMTGGNLSITQKCRNSTFKCSNSTGIRNSKFWIISGEDFPVDYSLGFTEGDYIVAPRNCQLLNSNTDVNKDGTIDIIIRVDGDTTIQFKNVESWWCHIGRNGSEHTEVYGASGTFSSINAGYVLGVAKLKTTVSINRNGSAISLKEYYEGIADMSVEVSEEESVVTE